MTLVQNFIVRGKFCFRIECTQCSRWVHESCLLPKYITRQWTSYVQIATGAPHKEDHNDHRSPMTLIVSHVHRVMFHAIITGESSKNLLTLRGVGG